MSSVAEKAEHLGQGKVADNSHPVHPAMVHYPVAFLSTGYALDVLYGLATHSATSGLVRQVYNLEPFLGEVARFSYYLNAAGLLMAVPAIVTGGAELMGMIKRQDLANKLAKSQNKASTVQRMHPKLKVAFVHALINDIGVVGAAYNWWTRRTAPMNVPDNTNTLISAAALPMLFFAAWLGGRLVYEYGVGVQRQGEGRRLKESGKAE